MSAIDLVGVPIDLGAGRRGTDMGPSALRLTSLVDGLRELGHEVADGGDLNVPIPESSEIGDATQRFATAIVDTCSRLAERTQASREAGRVPLVLGGDHSLSMGSIAGVAAAHRARGEAVGVIWVDAHGDINTPDTSPSGNVHGMPLAALLGHGPDALTGISGHSPAVRSEHAVLLGLRALDGGEQQRIRDFEIRAITMSEIDRRGIGDLADEAIAVAGAGTAGIYVSLDMDALDPEVAPGVGTPVRGGLSYREAHLLMELIAQSGRLIGMDVTEVNPALDHANATAALAAGLVHSAFGRSIL